MFTIKSQRASTQTMMIIFLKMMNKSIYRIKIKIEDLTLEIKGQEFNIIKDDLLLFKINI